jgi:predicted RecB family nuclease
MRAGLKAPSRLLAREVESSPPEGSLGRGPSGRRLKAFAGHLLFSPTDLNAFLACEHLTTLQVAVARGELAKPWRHNPHADLIRRKGDEHEAAYLARLRADGRDVVVISFEDRDWARAGLETERAIQVGADVVYQAALTDGTWRGFADFIERLPDGSYEVVDTKLARRARPSHVLQLCFYTDQLARIQGRVPDRMHVVTGLGERESFRPDDYFAYYRRLRARFLDAVERERETYPYPVDHCGLCEFLALCKARWVEDDHLTLVAGMSRLQVERLTAAGITTLERLAEAAPDTKVKSMRATTFQGLNMQAALQLHRRRTGEHEIVLLPEEPDHGFALMPEPSPGDVWLDLEGDPWFEPARGLEYLIGWIELDDDGEPRYEHLWAYDRESEKRAFERLVDYIVERRGRVPGMHVYHYAPYERTALSRLMGQHGTSEDEIDDLLRGEVLVDLFRVTKQALRASVPSYSIKEVERLFGFVRTAEVGGGGESVNAFETWLETGKDSLLDGIRDYNREDCVSLYELHGWLLRQRPDHIPWRLPPEAREPSEEAVELRTERDRVRDMLLDGAVEGEPRWLLAHLLEYHRREEKPQWWEYFHHRDLDDEELLDDGDTIGGLELEGEPQRVGGSFEYRLRFPAQEHKISGKGVDPKTEKTYKVSVDDEHGIVTLWRAVNRVDEPLPRALIPPRPLVAEVQRDAVLRFAKNQPTYQAVVDVLERRPPRALLDGSPTDAALSLDGTYLFVQGPPGSGKTWNGGRMAVALMGEGRRVGVTSLSHKAINKHLEEIEAAADEAGVEVRGLKKSTGAETEFRGRTIDNTGSNDAMLDPDLNLIAGTSWLFAREELGGHVDTLFVDEAGQFALADAVAVGTAARNLVLLGDPNQLPQVSQGAHPPGANASVLGHLLGEHETVQPGMGLFLDETWRMRPEVNEYISETFYEGRLEPAAKALTRSLAVGNGVRFLPVKHVGHRTAAPEEAAVVRDEIERLLGTPYSDEEGERPLRYEDFIVVAPYNSHVRCLRETLPEVVRVGTVDKFQGQEATVVFFAMASSSGEDVPRGLDFLFSRNRLNVAVSRARCLAYVVANPRLLETTCKTVEQMRLVNALCRFVEFAEEAPPSG